MASSTLCSTLGRLFLLQRYHQCLLRRATELHKFERHSLQCFSPFSVSCTLRDDPNKPKKSGDPGPHKNYTKKMNKKQKNDKESLLSSLLEGMKMIEADETSKSVGGGIFDELTAQGDPLKMNMSGQESETTQTEVAQTEDGLYDVLNKLKMKSETESDLLYQRRSTGSRVEIDSGTRQLNMKGEPVKFTPGSGKRLGWFTAPIPDTTTPENMTLAQEDEQKKLQALLLLKPKSYFEDLIEGNNIRYPRKFPIDNEDYDQGEEADVGFEDHVLLDHHLKEFPRKGAVRHFMELVVTGLSKNPHYTAAEKRDYIQWYKDYFSQFNESELQQKHYPIDVQQSS